MVGRKTLHKYTFLFVALTDAKHGNMDCALGWSVWRVDVLSLSEWVWRSSTWSPFIFVVDIVDELVK